MLIQLYQPDMCYLGDLKLKFVFHALFYLGLRSFLESVENDFTKVLKIQTENQKSARYQTSKAVMVSVLGSTTLTLRGFKKFQQKI